MDKTNIVKKYSNGEVTIVWKPGLCIHSAICVKGLPEVFKPKEKPWINVENAATEKLINQVKQCPSGALSFLMDGEEEVEISNPGEVKIKVIPNGPLQVHGNLKIVDAEGKETVKSPIAAFCRCGASKNKPFCDGTHNTIRFQD